MNSASSILMALLFLLVGALTSLALAQRRVASGWAAFIFVAAAGLSLAPVVLRTYTAGPDAAVSLLAIPAIGASLTVSVDHLSAIFLAIIAAISFLSTLYSVQYMTRYRTDSVAKYYPLLLLLFAGIVGVVVTADFVFFLVAWEAMTFASFFLVAYERESRAAQRAALKYFVVNQAAALGMLAGVLILWSRTGSFAFAAMREGMTVLLATRPALAHLVLFLFFMGFATKSGILPMGDWLPDAYPMAPSGATAAFGGTMTKLGIYGLLRVFLFFLPLGDATRVWGVVIALAGVASLFVGTLTALRQEDIKRLMSFHVIGQVGYMFLGIGMGLYFLPVNPVLGSLGLLAGVFHMVNHSLYKSCLFLGAGSVLYRTGQRNLTAVGGLRAAMPITAMCALGASLAIAGVPPFNGFASKWLMYATAILGGRSFPLFVVLGITAMFISLVTLASFLKYLGGAYFGVPRSREAIREVPWTMWFPQACLAGLCVLLGLVPGFPLHVIHRALVGIVPDAGIPRFASLVGGGIGLHLVGVGANVAAWSPIPIGVALLALSLFAFFALQRAGGAERREVPVWACGEETAKTVTAYPATSFYLPFKSAFHGIYPSVHARGPHFPPWLRRAFDVDAWFYLPVGHAVDRGARGFSRTHVGVPQVYLLWIVVGAVAVVGIMMAFLP